jgi:hypothetical protein
LTFTDGSIKGDKAVEERNRDYWTLTESLQFRGLRLPDHEYDLFNNSTGIYELTSFAVLYFICFYFRCIVWFGDFNYRTMLSSEEVQITTLHLNRPLTLSQTKKLIYLNNLDVLQKYDQLIQQHSAGLVFPEFMEGPLNFNPTYKYDNGSTAYDTSEKNRIPSWTDRILFCGNNLQLLEYARAELLISDHRPGKMMKLICQT